MVGFFFYAKMAIYEKQFYKNGKTILFVEKIMKKERKYSMRKKFFLLTVSFVLLLTGCQQDTGSDNKYSSDIGLPAHEYNIIFSEEIVTVCNQLTARMSNGRAVASGKVNNETELLSVDYSIDAVKKSYEIVKTLNPGNTYIQEYDEALRLIENAIDELNVYKGCLETGSEEEIRNCITRMEIIFTSLTALTNQVYK